MHIWSSGYYHDQVTLVCLQHIESLCGKAVFSPLKWKLHIKPSCYIQNGCALLLCYSVQLEKKVTEAVHYYANFSQIINDI